MTVIDSASRKRLFIGTFLSSQQQELLGTLKTDKLAEAWQRKIRFVKADKLHMTWVFLGDVDEHAIAEIRQQLKSALADCESIAVAYNQIEYFKAGNEIRSLVLTPETIPDALANTANKIRTATASFATKHNHHEHFRPHITLLRIESHSNKQAVTVGTAGATATVRDDSSLTTGLELPSWWNIKEVLPLRHNIDNVCLIESHVGDGAYKVIETFELMKS